VGTPRIAAAGTHVIASPQGYEIGNQVAKAIGTLLLLFACAYGPAFLVLALLKLRPFKAVPVIIVISSAVAILLIYAVSGKAGGFTQFGFRFCHYRYIAAAIVFGAPIGWALTILVNHLSSGPPPPEMSLHPWMMVLYFVVGVGGTQTQKR